MLENLANFYFFNIVPSYIHTLRPVDVFVQHKQVSKNLFIKNTAEINSIQIKQYITINTKNK